MRLEVVRDEAAGQNGTVDDGAAVLARRPDAVVREDAPLRPAGAHRRALPRHVVGEQQSVTWELRRFGSESRVAFAQAVDVTQNPAPLPPNSLLSWSAVPPVMVKPWKWTL